MRRILGIARFFGRALRGGARRLVAMPNSLPRKIRVHRAWAAPWWRKAVRASVVLTGLGIFIQLQLYVAGLIRAEAIFLLIRNAGIALALIIVVVNPTWGFVYWVFFSPIAVWFVRQETKFMVGFDFVVLAELVVVMTVRALVERSKIRKLDFAEWMLVMTFVYMTILRNTASVGTPPFASQLLVSPVVVYFIARAAMRRKEHIVWVATAFFLVGVVWAFSGIYEHWAGKAWFSPLVGGDYQITGEKDVGAGRSTGPAGHYYLYGNIIILALLLAYHRAGWVTRKWARALYYLSCPVLLLGLYYGYSRAPYLALGLALVIMLLLARISFKRYLAVTACVAVAVAMIVPLWMSDKELTRRLEASPAGRTAISATSWNMFRDYPWFGVGTGNYAKMTPQYLSGLSHPHKKLGLGLVKWWSAPHSHYWLMLTEQGVVGFVLYFGCIAAFLVAVFRIRGRLSSRGALGKEFPSLVIAFMCAVLLTMVTDTLYMMFMQAAMFGMFATVVRLDELLAEEKKEDSVTDHVEAVSGEEVKAAISA